VGAFALSFVAGFINLIGIVGFEHQAVSHVTGTVTQLSFYIFEFNLGKRLFLSFVLMSFLIGSILSGFLLYSSTLKKGRRYDVALVIESILLLFAVWYLNHGLTFGLMLTAAACGLQNALATTFSGAIVRTTHQTEVFTDMGISFSGYLRGDELDTRKVKLFILIILGFFIGGLCGAYLFPIITFYSLLIPALMCMFFALLYHCLIQGQ
jgi:uncharacterized membrane protein YoaK (UPF0700 family)